MQLKLVRRWLTPISTVGELFVDDVRFCFTLELPIKDGLPGSAIPEGTFKVTTYPSPHFERLMPLLEGIPNRSEIEMHFGNSAEDSRGCILLGYTHDQPNWIGQSVKAFNDFWAQAQGPMERGECFITIASTGSTHDEVQEASSGG